MGISKGRKKQNEKDIECSLREFTEETQFKAEDIKILDYNNPYNEIFFEQIKFFINILII